MDLESESSALESVEDNEVITPGRLATIDAIANNGPWGGEYDDWSLVDIKAKEDVGVTETVRSPPLTGKSSASSAGASPQATLKGYGLKKWRRIKRDSNRDGSPSADNSKILKRGFSTSALNLGKSQVLSVETKQKSKSSLSSTNGVFKSMGGALHRSPLDSGLAGPSFAAESESENSEDRSSKSSTAASAPKVRHEIPAVVGNARDKNRMKSLNAKNVANSIPRTQQGKMQVGSESSKKARGEQVKIEKENSHSSMESDSRSSNFVFMQGTNTVTNNGRHSGRSINYDGENSDDAQGGERHFSEEVHTSYRKENMREFEDISQEDLDADLSWEVKEENHRSSTIQDPLIESIHSLQHAQEQLEKEIQKLREIGSEDISLFDKIHEACPSDLLHPEESRFLGTQVASLEQNINLLESKLEEANTMLKEKDSKFIELESALKGNESSKDELGSTVWSKERNCREMEAELEGIFRQKIEAEVEYLAISRTVQKLGVFSVDPDALLEVQKTLASEQAQMLNEFGDAERKAAMLKRRAEKLETCCEDIVGTDEVLKLQKTACQVTTSFFIQLILLFVVIVLFFSQLSPHYAGVAPT